MGFTFAVFMHIWKRRLVIYFSLNYIRKTLNRSILYYESICIWFIRFIPKSLASCFVARGSTVPFSKFSFLMMTPTHRSKYRPEDGSCLEWIWRVGRNQLHPHPNFPNHHKDWNVPSTQYNSCYFKFLMGNWPSIIPLAGLLNNADGIM